MERKSVRVTTANALSDLDDLSVWDRACIDQ
jgi:hypothetical protein